MINNLLHLFQRQNKRYSKNNRIINQLVILLLSMSYLDEKTNQELYTTTFYTIKSQSYNPQTKTIRDKKATIELFPREDGKKKLREVLDKRYRTVLSSSLTKEKKNRQKFKPFSTINAIVRERHSIQERTQKIQNCAKYITQKISIESKKLQMEKLKQKRRNEIISESKSYRSFIESQIQKNNEGEFLRKIESRSVVLKHRQILNDKLSQSGLEKATIGQLGRKQSNAIKEQFKKLKQMAEKKNKEVFEKERKFQEDLHRSKVQRQHQLRKISEDNYRNKWMNELNRKRQAQKQNKMRVAVFRRKIQGFLKQTERIQQATVLKQQSNQKKL